MIGYGLVGIQRIDGSIIATTMGAFDCFQRGFTPEEREKNDPLIVESVLDWLKSPKFEEIANLNGIDGWSFFDYWDTFLAHKADWYWRISEKDHVFLTNDGYRPSSPYHKV